MHLMLGPQFLVGDEKLSALENRIFLISFSTQCLFLFVFFVAEPCWRTDVIFRGIALLCSSLEPDNW